MEAVYISISVEDLKDTIDKVKINNNKQQCPECESEWIEHDFKRMETVCRGCGLVLSGPPGYIGGMLQMQYPVQYNFFAEAIGKGHNTKHGYYKAYYYFPEYTDNFD